MPLTDPPFMPVKGEPPFHLRPWTDEEMEQYLRMRKSYEKCFKEDCGASSRCDNVIVP
jgi:hypothetical protein